jgi:hypothetical protein
MENRIRLLVSLTLHRRLPDPPEETHLAMSGVAVG